MKKGQLIGFILFFLFALCSCSNGKKFDSKTWKSVPDKRNNLVHSLFNEYNLKSMSRDEIIDLLGEPLKVGFHPKGDYPSGMLKSITKGTDLYYNAEDNNTIIYFFSSTVDTYEHCALYIKFDANNKVQIYDLVIFVT